MSKIWIPREYQKIAVQGLVTNEKPILLAPPSSGKTSVTLQSIKILQSAGKAKKILLLAPLRVCQLVWGAEIAKFSNFSHLRYVFLHGSKKEALLKQEADIYAINYEGLPWLIDRGVGLEQIRNFEALGFDGLVIDELSKFNDAQSRRAKLLHKVAHTFKFRWGLTGSPNANSYMGLFGQCKAIDLGKTFGRYLTQYRNNFFFKDYNGFTYHLRPGADKEIHGKLATIAHVIEANAEMELPEVVYNNIYVELPPSARKVYRDLETQLISNVQSNKIIADGAAAATIKCRQIASGAVYHDATVEEQETVSYRPYLELHDEKIEALKLLVNELQGAPLFVAYDFEHDLIRIKKSLGGNVPHLGSGCKDPESIVAQWNRGEIPVLLGHPASVGHGLNLQGSCNYVCWFSLTYNYDLYDQFNRRIRRTGNKFDRVFVYHLVARGTLDETIIDEVLPRKEKGQNALFAALKNKL